MRETTLLPSNFSRLSCRFINDDRSCWFRRSNKTTRQLIYRVFRWLGTGVRNAKTHFLTWKRPPSVSSARNAWNHNSDDRQQWRHNGAGPMHRVFSRLEKNSGTGLSGISRMHLVLFQPLAVNRISIHPSAHTFYTSRVCVCQDWRQCDLSAKKLCWRLQGTGGKRQPKSTNFSPALSKAARSGDELRSFLMPLNAIQLTAGEETLSNPWHMPSNLSASHLHTSCECAPRRRQLSSLSHTFPLSLHYLSTLNPVCGDKRNDGNTGSKTGHVRDRAR